MINAILFDLDMTLIDFLKMKRVAVDAAAKAMVKVGLPMKVSEAKDRLWETYLLDIEGRFPMSDFLEKFHEHDYRILAAGINAYRKTKYPHIKPYPKVKQTLLKLKKKGLKLGIVTDAPKIKAFIRLDEMGIADLFDVVVGLDDTGRYKPSKFPFKKALKGLRLKPSEVMHVGDFPERDILGAKKMGMLSCFARYGYVGMGRVVWADYKIEKFEDILDIVKNPSKTRMKVNKNLYK